MEETTPETTVEVTPPPAPLQEPKKRTEAEKAAFALKSNADRARELGLDPADILGLPHTPAATTPDDKPLTVAGFRELQKQDAHKTALQLADELPEDERAEVKDLLENRIVPSGDPVEDVRLARSAVNADRNAQIAEHIANHTPPKRNAAGGSGDGPQEAEFTPTPEEQVFMKPPYNLSKEKIIAARNKQ